MAFPTVAGFGGSNSGANVTTTTPDITALTGAPNPGDLIYITIVRDGAGGSLTWPARWSIPPTTSGLSEEQDLGTSSPAGRMATRCSVWQPGDSNPAVTHASEGTAWHVWRIAAGTWLGLLNSKALDYNVITGDSTNPNPPNLAPTWPTSDTLWLAVCGNDGNTAITAGPGGSWTNFQNDRWANSNGVGIASARLNSTVASVDPAAFTMTTEQWCAFTIGIRPYDPSFYIPFEPSSRATRARLRQ